MNYVIPANIETPYGELQKTKLWMIQGSPTTLVEGLAWYDSTAHLPKYYDGTNVKEFGRVYSAGTGISISNANVISFDDSVLDGYVQTNSVAELEGLTLAGDSQIIFPGGAIVNEIDSETGVNGLTISSYDSEEQADSPLVLYGSTLTFNGYDVLTSESVGVASGIATLDSNGKVPTSQLPSFVDDVIESYTRSGATALSSTWLSATDGGSALTPETGKIYVVLSSGTYLNKTYRWSGSTYVEISASPGAASESAAGIIEIATNSEVTTGTDDTRAVTPKKLADNYQTKLVSGTSIKTINNTSLLGSGNISISVPTKISDLTDDTSTNPIDKADTLTGLTATVAELNILDGATLTTTELNYVDGVTSNIQTQLNSKQATLVSGTNIKTINSTSLLGSGNINVLQNTATGTDSLTMLGTATTQNCSINIGKTSSVSKNFAVAIGYNSVSSGTSSTGIGHNTSPGGDYSTALGYSANTSQNSAIQLGYGNNGYSNTLSVGFYNNSTTHYNWQLLDGTTGLIPDARISSTAKKLKYTENNSALTATGGVATWEITHGLGTDDVMLVVRDLVTLETIFPAWKIASGKVIIEFLASSNIAANTYRAIIMG